MPRRYIKKTRRWGKKKSRSDKTAARRKTARASRVRLARSGGTLRLGLPGKPFLPATALVTHRYSECYVINDGAGTAIKSVSLNSMFDPDPAVGGHQPFGSDQMRTMYDRYTVVGVSYKATFYSSSASGVSIVQSTPCFAIVPRADHTGLQESLPVSVSKFHEEGWKSRGHLRHPYGGKPLTLSGTWSAKRHFRDYVDDDRLIRDDKISATEGANPVTQAFIYFGNFRDDGGDAASLQCRVTMSYHCLWHAPKALASS